MAEWWNALNLLQQIFLCAAIPFTIVLIIQTILTFIGIGGHGDTDTADMDSNTDFDPSIDAGGHIDGHFDGPDHVDGNLGSHPDDVNAAVAGFRLFHDSRSCRVLLYFWLGRLCAWWNSVPYAVDGVDFRCGGRFGYAGHRG